MRSITTVLQVGQLRMKEELIAPKVSQRLHGGAGIQAPVGLR